MALKENHEFIPYSSRGQKSETNLIGLKVKVLAGLVPSGDSEGRIYFLAFSL